MGAACRLQLGSKRPSPYSELVKTFRYDERAPLAVDVISSVDEGGLRIQTIEFEIGAGVKCSAELIEPGRSRKYPGVVWLGSGDKDWESYANEFSKLGAVSILPDSWCGKASLVDAQRYYSDRVQMVINVRRAASILSARKDADPNRIAFVGRSGGTILGADAVAVDKRFKASVFEARLQGFTYHICTSRYPFAVNSRKDSKIDY
jgi:hypothetical protein